jgi:hypothetical protein
MWGHADFHALFWTIRVVVVLLATSPQQSLDFQHNLVEMLPQQTETL